MLIIINFVWERDIKLWNLLILTKTLPKKREIRTLKTNNSSVFLTFALLHVLPLLPRLLLAILGLRGAPVPLPLQHMADHHPQQAQEEEDGHQDEGDVV